MCRTQYAWKRRVICNGFSQKESMNVSKTIPMFPQIRLTNRSVRRRKKWPEKCQSCICVSNENLTNIHTLVSFAVKHSLPGKWVHRLGITCALPSPALHAVSPKRSLAHSLYDRASWAFVLRLDAQLKAGLVDSLECSWWVSLLYSRSALRRLS